MVGFLERAPPPLSILSEFQTAELWELPPKLGNTSSWQVSATVTEKFALNYARNEQRRIAVPLEGGHKWEEAPEEKSQAPEEEAESGVFSTPAAAIQDIVRQVAPDFDYSRRARQEGAHTQPGTYTSTHKAAGRSVPGAPGVSF